MEILLIAGLWLDASVWDDVGRALEGRGHRPVPIALPGQGDGNTSATLDDQVGAVLDAVDAAERPIVVGHSAACTLAWLAADARPEKIFRLSLVGGFPSADGSAYFEALPIRDGALPFPGWEPFDGPDSADLDDAAKRSFAARAIPVPEGVCRGVVRLSDERRFDVPVQLVCPEFSPDDARAWIAGGDVPELARAEHITLVDIDSGHWPMISAPERLAEVLTQS